MNAQMVFDIDGVREIIFSYCLPQFYPIVTKKMIDDKRDKLVEDAEIIILDDPINKLNQIRPPKLILMTNEMSNWRFPEYYSEIKKKEFKRKYYKNIFLSSLGIRFRGYTDTRTMKGVANRLTKTSNWLRREHVLWVKEKKIKEESEEAHKIYYKNHYPKKKWLYDSDDEW